MGPRTMVSPNRSRSPYLLTPLLKEDPGIALEQSKSCIVDLGNPSNTLTLCELLNATGAIDQQIHAPAFSSSSNSIYNPNGTLSHKRHDDELLWEISQLEDPGCDEKPTVFHETMPEDFMIPPGSIGADGECQPLLGNAVQQQWLSYLTAPHHQQHMGVIGSNMLVFGNGIENGGYSENPQTGMAVSSVRTVRPTSSDSQTATETNRPDEKIDKSIERRQKRMIKNRESAARSRAKKQAYINKLQEEVEQLKAKNEQLKKEKEEEVIFSIAIPERRQLRRTTSSPI